METSNSKPQTSNLQPPNHPTTQPSDFSIHPATLLGHVSLTVANLDNQIAFYQRALGFVEHWREGNSAGMGAGGADLLRLTEQPNLKRYRGVTGLYHFAVLFPNRRELARAVARLFAMRYTDGTLSDGREALDVEALFSHLKEDDRLDQAAPLETRVGHVHLHVGNVGKAVDFYHGIIGFDVMGMSKSFRAAFVSAGGYHHHLGLNTWQGEGAPPPPPDAVGLRYFVIELPNEAELNRVVERVDRAGLPTNKTDDGILVHDPFQNGVILGVKK
ncbi:MAG: VOC family protein [Chloroflexi bacterium]|nr:VOC family protein [Chloroflexota bacterium]